MKLKSLVFGFCFSLCASVFAGNQHAHPEANNNQAPAKEVNLPGNCEIEIINNSYQDVRVNGRFDDGVPMIPFNVYSFESPHYISLYYYGYCHSGMDLYIDTFSGYNIYAGWTKVRTTLRIVPFLDKQAKIVVQAK